MGFVPIGNTLTSGLPVIRQCKSGTASTQLELKLRQLRAFGFRLFEDRHIRVGALPKGKEILISRFRFRAISYQHVRAAELKVNR